MNDSTLTPELPSRIHYVVVHPTRGASDFSYFQGYGPGLMATAYAFARIATLPLDVWDFVRDPDEILAERMNGRGCSIIPLQVDALSSFVALQLPFVCVVSHSDTSDDCRRILADAKLPVHHVALPTTSAVGARLLKIGDTYRLLEDDRYVNEISSQDALPDLSYEALRAYVLRSLPHLSVDDSLRANRDRLAQLLAGTTAHRVAAAPRVRHHFTTEPTEAALLSLGYALEHGMPPGGADSAFIQAIVDAAAPLVACRQRVLDQSTRLRFFRPSDAILAAPAVLAHWYLRKSRQFRPSTNLPGDKLAAAIVRSVANSIVTQRGYVPVATSDNWTEEMRAHPAAVAILINRRHEARTFAAQLAVRAAVDGIPVFRLSPRPNLSRSTLAKLTVAARGGVNGNSRAKLNRFAKQLSAELQEAVPRAFLLSVSTTSARIKLIADAPLEWTKVGRVPLMLRADCSRIPATPGNISFGNTVGGSEHLIPLPSLQDVLIIRSFASDDPIRHTLWTTVRLFLARTHARIKVRLVDVSSLDDLVAALESFSGAMVVFDGHASPGTSTTPGTLIIGGQQVDMWQIRGRVRLPPIAFLSACDTHSFDSSHATPAQALLAAGAVTVVGTSLPVNAQYAAMFVARLLYRIDAFVPVAMRGPLPVLRWSMVLPGLQRMNFVTEMLDAIDRKNSLRISPAMREAAAFVGNLHINGFDAASDDPTYPTEAQSSSPFSAIIEEERSRLIAHESTASEPMVTEYPYWLDAVIARLASDGAGPRQAIEAAVEDWAWITDALKYVEIGNPERLVLVGEPRREPSQGASASLGIVS